MHRQGLTFLDASVVAHAAGNIGYAWAVRVLRSGLTDAAPLVADALCLQELEESMEVLLDPDHAGLAAQIFHSAVREVMPVTRRDFVRSREIARQAPGASPRECLHAAVMEHAGIGAVCAVLESNYATVAGLRPLSLLENTEELDER